MQDLQLVFENLFSNTLNFLRQPVLNLGITYLQLFFGVFILNLVLSLLGNLLGVGFVKANDVSVSGSGGNSNKIQVDSRFSDPDYRKAFDYLSKREHSKGVHL